MKGMLVTTQLLAGLVVTASVAAAPPASATGSTLAWDGVRGLDAPTACAAGQDPYLHWVLTPGGRTKVPTAGTSLDVDGEVVQARREGNGTGAIHFFTDYHDPASITSAVATLGGAAARNAHLTISSGCSGTTTPPDGEDPEPLPCDETTSSGGQGSTTNVHDVGATSGQLTLHAFAYGVPDRFRVVYQGTTLVDEAIGTGAFAGALGAPSFAQVSDKTYTVSFSGSSRQVTVEVLGDLGTVWDYTISCAAPPA